ncbi:MAG TPA: hypothetical protein DEP53_06125 [Bacteroidetes bacterium]|nr:hypothetical protein [Bacteroidota bacterium]
MHEDYASIFKEYSEKIEARVKLLRHEYADYIRSLRINPSHVSLPIDLLFDVVRNHFVDLHRMKIFHQIENANSVKIAAYQTFWIARIKPIQVTRVDTENPQRFLLINEFFAIHALISQLYNNASLSSNDLKQWNKFIQQLAYHLRFRVLDPRSLELAIIALGTRDVFPRRNENEGDRSII